MGRQIEKRPPRPETMNQVYLDTARLLIQVAPLVMVDNIFALKGGTAINLFVRDMPRLSVDLDLVFVDHTLNRDQALAEINQAIRAATERLRKRLFQTHVATNLHAGEAKLFVRRDKIEVKVEVNYVMRGIINPTRTASLTPQAQAALLANLELTTLSIDDLYGGTLVAAMDRQHPRDLFDVMQLLAFEGITPGIRRSFVAHLAGHNRPIHEVLFPNRKDLFDDYTQTFLGMTTEPVELSVLISVREKMIRQLQDDLDENERNFLISLVRNKPNWALLNIAHLDQLPSSRWKMKNIEQLAITNPKKFEAQANELERLLKN